MRVKLSEIRQVVREEMDRLNESEDIQEAVPFKGVARQAGPRRSRRRSRSSWAEDPTDAPEPGMTPPAIQPNAARDASRAVGQALQALQDFNPKWHRLVCRTKQGKEMSDLVIDLEQTLKELTRELSESAKFSANELREMVFQEAKKLGLAEAVPFGGVASMNQRRRDPRRLRGRSAGSRDVTAAPEGPSVSPTVTKAQKLVSDWLFLHSTFSPKFRRSLCLGKAGDRLAFALQNLEDMLGKM